MAIGGGGCASATFSAGGRAGGVFRRTSRRWRGGGSFAGGPALSLSAGPSRQSRLEAPRPLGCLRGGGLWRCSCPSSLPLLPSLLFRSSLRSPPALLSRPALPLLSSLPGRPSLPKERPPRDSSRPRLSRPPSRRWFLEEPRPSRCSFPPSRLPRKPPSRGLSLRGRLPAEPLPAAPPGRRPPPGFFPRSTGFTPCAARRGRRLAESPRGRAFSCASCRPSASPAASSCASRRRRSTWR